MCDSVPIWIPDSEFETCYDEFCHQASHSMALSPLCSSRCTKDKFFYESASFNQYRSVSQHFAGILSRTTTKVTSVCILLIYG
ncbi:hypothetical protein EDD16DRAFT_1623990 [Pisolithus croceorrhizus]|nr:hypothetical protein EDD16DRAFT_1623990 [Pisolithus croceorrhizus]